MQALPLKMLCTGPIRLSLRGHWAVQQAVGILLAQLRFWPRLRLLCWLQPVYISADWARSFFVLANRA